VDPKRRIRCGLAFSEDSRKGFPFIHARDIASLQDGKKYKVAFKDADEDDLRVTLHYPGESPDER
jgi:hypothetical protein